jgi:hypothetical protein
MDIQKINSFLAIHTIVGNDKGSGYGYGYGNGYGTGTGTCYGYGYGYGNGDGEGNGYGTGNGDGYGNGYGDGEGNGYGTGNGDGDGVGDGDGDGSGYGDGIKSFNNQPVNIIDKTQTIITSIKNNIAKGFILQPDLSLLPCYIAKGENQFAHGSTIHEAVESLQEKLLIKLSIEQRIFKFKEKFSSLKKKYKAIDYFNWHYFLTGSCNMGRMLFINQNNINLEKDKFTVLEFIEKTKNQYGSNIIDQLKQFYPIN